MSLKNTDFDCRAETIVKLSKFEPRPYQLPICKALEVDGFKKFLIIMPRRSGKDIVCWNLLIRAAIRKVGIYFYCLPTFSQARRVIFDSLTNDGHKFIDFIPRELIKKINTQEMKITLLNNSIIQLIGSNTYDTSLVGSNASMIVFSEFALADHRAYQYSIPILRANDGTVMLISCVAPDTLVMTRQGLKRIKALSSSREEYTSFGEDIYGLQGFHTAESFYYGGKQKTLIITLQSGYQLECTANHKVWTGSQWKPAGEWSVGDLLPIQYGQECWSDGINLLDDFKYTHQKISKEFIFDTESVDFFYLLGLIHADGSYNKNAVCVTKKKDQKIIDFLHIYLFRTRSDGIHHEYSSRELCALLEHLGFKYGARNKEFPEKILQCSREQVKAFLQGLFDGDGTSNSCPSKRGKVKLTSTCLPFMRTLQVVLLNFGIVSSIYQEEKAPTAKVKVWSTIYNLEIAGGYFTHLFYREIGFRLARKQKHWEYVPKNLADESGNIYPVDLSRLADYNLPRKRKNKRMARRTLVKFNEEKQHPYLQELLSEKLFYSPIKSINYSENEVFDFVIPDTHSFFSNGFLSHNTPRGHNAFYDLYQVSQHSPDWFSYRLTIDDTHHISHADIERDIANGEISRHLAQQEYLCSFDIGQEGAIYNKYIDRMRLEGKLSFVEWEPAFKVHTAWDLGMRDFTSIIFFQICGTSIHIIDYYENHSEGLEHYFKYLASKDYDYGKHIAPHDIEVRELGTGVSRLEKARQLGISFTVAKKLSLEDGIEAVRTSLPKMWIDERKCAKLIKALENYHYKYDESRNQYSVKPEHSIESHACDAMRYLCVSLKYLQPGMTAEDMERNYREAICGNEAFTPMPFKQHNRW